MKAVKEMPIGSAPSGAAALHAKMIPGSFRDPSGFLYRDEDGVLLRQISRIYEDNFRLLGDCGLLDDLTSSGLLIEHEEVRHSSGITGDACCVIRPRELLQISYPYEWSFSMLKHAALLTLEIQRRSLEFGMTLKDASAYNVQFDNGRPVFIDTLSFEAYREGAPWIAYQQFCRHFLGPLALMAKTDIELGRLTSLYIDGLELRFTSRLLPWRTWLHPGLFMHVHLHSRMISGYSKTDSISDSKPARRISKKNLLALIESLTRTVRGLKWVPGGTEWSDYYASNSYTDESTAQKRSLVRDFLVRCQPKSVWDLGANTGIYSRLASELGAKTVAFDIDPACVEKSYLACVKEKQLSFLPLRLDLTSPSPAVGWAHTERMSLSERGPVDVVMALALIHHLAISNNLPFSMVARYFSTLGQQLIIEYVPKNDPQSQRLLRSRKDIFTNYTREAFEAAFRHFFTIVESQAVGSDGRVLYLMRSSNGVQSGD